MRLMFEFPSWKAPRTRPTLGRIGLSVWSSLGWSGSLGATFIGGSVVVVGVEVGEHHFGETELREIGDAHRVQDAEQVVDLVLHHARVEAVDVAADRLLELVDALVAQTGPARHAATQTGNRQTTLERLFC